MTPEKLAREVEKLWDGALPPQGQRSVLALYATDHDLRILRPEDGPEATRDEHEALVRQVAALLTERHGLAFEFITLDASSYLRWLAAEGKKNTAENRAAWIGLQSTTEK